LRYPRGGGCAVMPGSSRRRQILLPIRYQTPNPSTNKAFRKSFRASTERLCKEGRVGVEPTRDGFAIRCLSHLATAPEWKFFEAHSRRRRSQRPQRRGGMGKKDASVQPGVLYRIDRQLVHPAEGFLREISLSKTGHIDVQAKKSVR
jgi:hypothetical protein